MVSIALSDALKGGNKLEKTSALKGKDVADGPGNAAVFALMLSGSLNPNVDPKGQNSEVGSDLEENSSAVNIVQSVQNLNQLGSMLGYGNFVLSFLTQPMLQSNLPAGKEANSGNDVSQLSAPTGMTTQKIQEANPAITELDKYRQVIADLLVKLSGEISDITPKGTPLGLESTGTKELSQDIAKIVQGWMAATDNEAKEAFALGGDFTGGQVNANSSSSQVTKDTRQDMAKMVEDWITATDEDAKLAFTSSDQKGIKPLLKNVVNGKTVAVPVWEQISTAFREQVLSKQPAVKELDIQLHPVDLGKIQIAMRWENGQVHLQVRASEATTAQLLQSQLPELRQSFSNQGVNCGMLQMGQDGSRQQNSHGDESQRRFHKNTYPNEDEDLISATKPLSFGQDEINRINVTA